MKRNWSLRLFLCAHLVRFYENIANADFETCSALAFDMLWIEGCDLQGELVFL